MIARLIALCVRNRLMVLIVTAAVVGAGIWSMFHIRLDALPDLSDVQVIVVTEYPGQNPEVVNNQVTYPLTTAMLSVPGSTVVRGFSMFELSFVYVLFDEGTDIYWARSRVLEYLNFARDRLPEGVQPKLGPDATGVGWVYQYILYPGFYCPDHPKGIWRDGHDGTDKWYASPGDAPADRREGLERVRGFEKAGACPLDGTPLVSSGYDLAGLRSLQDWYLRYPLTAVEGVSEVASIGGFVRQYQVVLDPLRLQAFHLAVGDIATALRRSNNDVGGSVVEMSEHEYMVRSRGYLHGLDDIAKVPVGVGEKGTPILLGDVATLEIGGEARRGVGEYNGIGEAVGGVVIARFGENAYKVIRDAKARLFDLEGGLPPGVFVRPTYDRSSLIERSVATLRDTLIEEIVVVGLVCIAFLLHARSELVAVFVVPSGVLVALMVMDLAGINANIMSLGGIAIAIGVMVDASIVMVENAHKHLDREEERLHAAAAGGEAAEPRPRSEIIVEAAQEVGPTLFFSLAIITVSFLPVFVLGGEAGRLFRPLAMTKTLAMASASILAVTIVPVLMHYLITARVLPAEWGRRRNTMITAAAMLVPALLLYVVCGLVGSPLAAYRGWTALAWIVLAGMLLIPQRIIHEKHSPISRVMQAVYDPVFRRAMRHHRLVLALAVLAMLSTLVPATHIGTEFMPPLDEGDLLYMPTTDPSISITKSKELLQQTNKLIRTFPEVKSVHGKIGRAETATDPAPLSMIETVVQLEPDTSKWRHRTLARFFSDWPDVLRSPLSYFWPLERPIRTDELKYGWQDADGTMHPGLNQAVSLPGVANAWPFPIENRLNMLATGIKTPVGVKVLGPDLKVLGDLAEKVANAVRTIDGTISAYPERTFGGYYLDFDVDRVAAARYGLTTGDVQDIVQTAIGGMNVTWTVEGLERYPLNVRYARELRDDLPSLRAVLVSTPSGAQIPLGQVARLDIHAGPPMIKSENAQPTSWVYVDIAGRDLGSYIADARRVVAEQVPLPPGYTLLWSGQFEFWEKTIPRLIVAGILTMIAIVLLLYMSTQSWPRVAIVMLAVPFSLIGAFWLLWALGYNMSLAVVIGMIALAGLDAETGLVMLLYLENSFDRFVAEGRMRSREDLWSAIHDGAVRRIRPKAMTVGTAFIGLVPLLWASGTGADVMRRLAAPMIGGLLVSFAMELVVYPILFFQARSWQWRRRWQT
ncbi:MAG TPA: efflux RND transporter permease subunit [Candidatus Binatia bacterium]|jgi:Cu(I)/Ag(I) efflux system membrane protein CusA/SilA